MAGEVKRRRIAAGCFILIRTVGRQRVCPCCLLRVDLASLRFVSRWPGRAASIAASDYRECLALPCRARERYIHTHMYSTVRPLRVCGSRANVLL